jgi:pimeloyl-ACP methyl ester carboxylesterase
VVAHKSIGDVADHLEAVIRRLEHKPVLIGHSFGGLLTQILAGRGLASVSVAIDPAPFRGVLPLPISSLRSAQPVLGNPLNRNRAVPLTYEQFRYGFANAVDEGQAAELYKTYAVPASGAPLFQAAAANLNPWTEARVDTRNPERGPLLIISGDDRQRVERGSRHRARVRAAIPCGG